MATASIEDTESLRNGKIETIQKMFNFYDKKIEFYINGYKHLPLHIALFQIRMELNLSAEQIAIKAPVGRNSIANFEKGEIVSLRKVFLLIMFYKKKIKYRIT